MIYKITLLPLPRGSGHDRKMVSEHCFQTLECIPLRSKYDLNHVSLPPILGVTKPKAKRTLLEEVFLKEVTAE